MPSTTSRLVSIVLDSSTVMTPSLPTFFIASAMMEPICLSLLALMVPTCAIMSPFTSLWNLAISATATSTACSMPRFSAVGLAPAATVFTPSRKMACASTVAVVVPSPATSEVFDATSRTICAPMFSSGSWSSISFATVTPSLVMIGAPNFFSITALRPLGPSVIFTASARALTPRRIDWRDASPVTICFAMSRSPLQIVSKIAASGPERMMRTVCPSLNSLGVNPSPKALRVKEKLLLATGSFGCAGQFGQDFIFPKDEIILVVHFDFRAAVLAEQYAVAGLYIEGDAHALFDFARADGDHFALLRLFFRRVGDDDAALDGFFLFDPLDQDAIVQRSYIY